MGLYSQCNFSYSQHPLVFPQLYGNTKNISTEVVGDGATYVWIVMLTDLSRGNTLPQSTQTLDLLPMVHE